MCRANSNADELCNAVDQRRVSETLRQIPGHSIRSFRRGSLVYYASCVVSDTNLLKLSGHKNEDTLLRYLGWGQSSSEAAAAAIERTDLAHMSHTEAGPSEPSSRDSAERVIVGGSNSTTKPMWMGRYSGFNGKKGKRITAPPELFPKNAPSAKDLGIEAPIVPDDRSQWKLHVKKDMPCVNLDELEAIITAPELKELNNHLTTESTTHLWTRLRSRSPVWMLNTSLPCWMARYPS